MLTLDSNVLIGYLNGDKKIADRLLAWRGKKARFFISVITEIEILSLPKLSAKEISKIREFLREFTIIPLDSQLATICSEIRRQRNLRLGDSAVVATALLTNSTLITQDREIIRKSKNLIRAQSIK